MKNADSKGVIIVAYSEEFKQLINDLTAGMSDMEVVEKTAIPFGTWRRIKAGNPPEDDNMIKLTGGLDLEEQDILALFQAAYGKEPDWVELSIKQMESTLRFTKLPPHSRLRVMQTLREELAKLTESKEQHEAA